MSLVTFVRSLAALFLVAATALLVVAVLERRPTGGLQLTLDQLPPVASGGAALGPVDIVPPAQRGDPPAVTFHDESGKPLTLADFRGRVVLVNFWATWCAPCVAEMPGLDALLAGLAETKLAVVAVNVDHEGVPVARKFYADKGIRNLAIYAGDLGGLGAEALPTSLLIDKQGRLVWRGIGQRPWTSNEVQDKLRTLLAENPAG